MSEIDANGRQSVLTCQRHRFELAQGLHYLNGAYMSPLSKTVLAAGHDALQLKADPTHLSPADFFTQSQEARARFARLINAPADRIALIPAVSYGMATVAQNLALQPGQSIIILHEQFPSNVYPWRRLAARTGADIVTVHPPQGWPRGEGWNNRLLNAIDGRTGLIAVPHVHWTDGTRFDLIAVGQRAREVGAALVVDGTQSVGALPFDVGAIQPDALVTAAYKWLMGPYGIGFAYCGDRFRDGVPLEENWITRAGAEDFSRLVDYQDDYAAGAVRFDMGERSNPPLLAMAIAALGEILEYGPAARQDYCQRLIAPFLSDIEALGIRIEPADRRAAHLFGLHLPPDSRLSQLQQALKVNRVAVSVRGDAVRVAPNVYNDVGDMQALLCALRAGL